MHVLVRWQIKGVLILALVMLNTSAYAATSPSLPKQSITNCWNQAGARYSVSPQLLYAIAKTESDLNPYAYELLDSSESRGIMQINSYWYPTLKTMGINEDDLWNPCTNIHVGAWILSQEIERYGNSWTAIGAYNAGGNSPEKKVAAYKQYTRKIFNKLYKHQTSK